MQQRPLALLCQRRLVRALIVATIFGVLLSCIDRRALIGHLGGVDQGVVAVMLVVNGILLLVSAWRWHWIAAAAMVRAPWREFVRATWISWAASELGPSLVLGEWVRFQRLRRCAPPLQLALTQFVDRLSAYIGLLALAVVSAGWYAASNEGASAVPLTVIIPLSGAAGVITVALMLRRFHHTLIRETGALDVLHKLLFAPAHYGLSLLTNLLFTANFVLAARAVGCDVSVWSLLLVVPLVLLGAGSLPSLISDWGKREAAAALALTQIGVEPEQGVAISLVYGVVHLAGALPGLLLLIRRTPAR